MAVRKRTEYTTRDGRTPWYYDFWHRDRRYRKTGFATKAEAEIAETREKRLVYSGKTTLRPSTFAELIEPFFAFRQGRVAPGTLTRDRRRIPPMLGHFGDKRIALITGADIEQYVNRRLRDGMSPRTINLEINLLSSIFQCAAVNGYVHENPVRQVRRLKTVQVDQLIPSGEQFPALVDAARKTEGGLQVATWITLRGYTGTRPAESFFLEWSDIDLVKAQIHIRPKDGNPPKTRKARVVPMHPELKAALVEWRKAWDVIFSGKRPHDWVFVHPRNPRLRANGFRKTYLRAQRLAGLTEHMTSHCLRHFFISKAVESGVNSLVIARWVGHSTTRMIEQVYAHLSPEFRNGEMRKIQLGLGNGMKPEEKTA